MKFGFGFQPEAKEFLIVKFDMETDNEVSYIICMRYVSQNFDTWRRFQILAIIYNEFKGHKLCS